MKHLKIALIGGSGFVGQHLTNELVNQSREVIVLSRVREHAQSLIMLPTVDVVEVDARNVDALTRATRDADAVINLVGIRYETSRMSFDDIHVGMTEAGIEACRRNGIRRFIQMSALNAAPGAASAYLRSKGEAEARVAASGLDWTIFQPSVIFGPEDRFLNVFATLARVMPIIFLPGASARFQPIYVGDVVKAMAAALDDTSTFGISYPLCGPRVYTLRELVRFAAQLTGHRPWIFGLPPSLSNAQAWVLEHMPGKLLTRDNLLSMRIDSVSDVSAVALLGGPPRALEDTVPEYFGGRGRNERYTQYRRRHR